MNHRRPCPRNSHGNVRESEIFTERDLVTPAGLGVECEVSAAQWLDAFPEYAGDAAAFVESARYALREVRDRLDGSSTGRTKVCRPAFVMIAWLVPVDASY